MSRYAEPVRAAPIRKKAPMAATPVHHKRAATAQAIQLRRTLGDKAAAPVAQPVAKALNRSGLPRSLQAGVERLSGLAMDDVRVHRNSPEPARLGALAYTRGSDIHLGPGQEQHLPHEAWHVVQQKQGRVRATTQLKGVGLNMSGTLEREADTKGEESRQIGKSPSHGAGDRPAAARPALGSSSVRGAGVVQPKLAIESGGSVVPFTIYNDTLDLYVRIAADHYNYASSKMKGWIGDKVDRTYPSLDDVIKAIEDPYKAALATAEFAKASGVKSTNKGNADPVTIKNLNIIRSAEFQQGLENAMKTQTLDYKGGSADFVRSHIKSRVEAYSAQVLQAGNCGEFAEISYWKMMELTKGSWIGRSSLFPSDLYDHGFDILSDVEFSAGVGPEVADDAIVVDGWFGYKVLMLGDFLNTQNPYGKVLTRNNVRVRRVEKTIGYDILDSKLKAAADAAIKQFVLKID